MFSTRRLVSCLPRTSTLQVHARAAFHASSPAYVNVGDHVPNLNVLHENSPGDKVNLAAELVGNGLIIGVPAAFSPSCSNSHIPGYINHPKLSSAGQVFVVSVNDAFVYLFMFPILDRSSTDLDDCSMKAWASALDPSNASGIRFLADPAGEFTRTLDLAFDGGAVFGGDRSKRYALVVEDGKVKQVHVEPDNTGVDVSTAEKVLKDW
ncbi:Peroxiredoxin-5, mitochondrial [Xylographa carneopallida]|nr:Peroxiredoxin-5, mitochondrial [Xylographa carneopallida]